MNIRELDEESRRTGVWPPRRIILRVEEGEADEAAAGVKVGEVDLNAPRAAVAEPKPRTVPPLPTTSLAPSVTPSRRPGLPGSRGVTPAPAASPEDADFEQWIAAPLPDTPAEPEYQETPAWLPDDVRVRAERRHRRVARKARTQLFGASAATTLAVGGCVAALAVIGLSQTESVGGSLGVPSIGLFGSAPAPASHETAQAPKPQPTAKTTPTKRHEGGRAQTRRARSAAPPARPARTTRNASAASPTPRASSTRRASATPAASTAPAPQPVRQAAPVTRQPASNPPPPPARAKATPQPSAAAPVVWDAPSAPAHSAPSHAAPTVSRPVSSAPAPTTSAPAP